MPASIAMVAYWTICAAVEPAAFMWFRRRRLPIPRAFWSWRLTPWPENPVMPALISRPSMSDFSSPASAMARRTASTAKSVELLP